MKYMFASDIHGSAYYCREMFKIYKESGADRLILLGDLLYHGPRNDLPREYDPKAVTAMLNDHKNEIYAVRGNCEAEVDQMVLEFPVMADYAVMVLNGLNFFVTHGHLFHQDQLPPMKAGDILIHGHTHLLRADAYDGYYILNPGSTSLPKGGNPSTYGILDGTIFSIRDFDGNVVKTIDLA
ncbi:MAG: phosphodiesterase [Lachnospiraceae bacterium]|nr:phosphodiesterase [Lachnospiraceae bacterium]